MGKVSKQPHLYIASIRYNVTTDTSVKHENKVILISALSEEEAITKINNKYPDSTIGYITESL